MGADELLHSLLRNLGYNLPALIALIVGMVVTQAAWHRHPPAARWAMLAFVWMFISYLLAICWYSFGILLILDLDIVDQGPILMVLSCCEALGYIFFIIALNTARTPYRQPSVYDQFRDDDPRDS
ncbi:MAG: hypothetical protein HY289_13530 [Planctomycetes bacterium]|nr:hypothetical protein [Planctomycetota bacterium]